MSPRADGRGFRVEARNLFVLGHSTAERRVDVFNGGKHGRSATTDDEPDEERGGHGPTDEERQLAVTKAESEHAFAYETSDGVAAAYGITQLTGSLDDELRYVDRLRAVTREQIRDIAIKYLPLTDYACIAFVPGKK